MRANKFHVVIRAKFLVMIAALLFISIGSQAATLAGAVRDDASEARQAVRRSFDLLKSRQYGELYDSLSASSRSRMTRAGFVRGMERTQDSYDVNRVEIGSVRVRGNTAVVNTVIYGRVLKPLEGEGKIVSQQTLVREDGQWRISTASPGTGLSTRAGRVFIKRDGRWVDVTAALRASQRRRGR